MPHALPAGVANRRSTFRNDHLATFAIEQKRRLSRLGYAIGRFGIPSQLLYGLARLLIHRMEDLGQGCSRASSMVQPVNFWATAFMKRTRPTVSQAMTPSPIDSRVVRYDWRLS